MTPKRLKALADAKTAKAEADKACADAAPKRRTNSREKGGRGERDAITALARIGIVARRTASMQAGQKPGGPTVPDLMCDAPWDCLWLEVKRTEQASEVFAGIHQAAVGVQQDAAAQTVPVCLYRRNRQPWVVVVPEAYLTPVERPVVTRAADAVRVLTRPLPHDVVSIHAEARPPLVAALLGTGTDSAGLALLEQGRRLSA
jgi:Holliday junction resolvase